MDVAKEMGVRELDLSNWHANAMAERLNHAVPAIKSSKAFLTFLRANLVLDPSAISNANTPVLQPTSHHSLFVPSSEAAPVTTPEMDEDIPDMSLEILTDPVDKDSALRLIGSSIIEQRQDVALSFTLHPINLVAISAVVALTLGITQLARQELNTLLQSIIVAALIFAYLVIIHHFTSPYASLAASLSQSFLYHDLLDPPCPGSSDGTSSSYSSQCSTPIFPEREDLILATRNGTLLTSVLVLHMQPRSSINHNHGHSHSSSASSTSSGGLPATCANPGTTKRRSKGSSGNASPFRGGKGVIRAWTTGRAWRGRGSGTELLREAVRVTKERCGRDAEVGFAREHANSMTVLPEVFNWSLRRGERKAAMSLERVVGEWEPGRRRR